MADDGVQRLGPFDYVIVGAGTAGCVLANRLSADPKTSVLLLEAGGKDSWLWIHIPIGYLYTQNNPRTDWCFKTEPEPGLNGRALNYPRGRVLGGCSSINGMIYMRGQARDYDGWRQQGNRGWGWDDVLPYFKKSEHYVPGADDLHGSGGEWRVETPRLSWEILDAFRDAAAEVGIPKVTDFNRGNNEGCGYFEVNQKNGVRWSTAKAFLRPAAGRGQSHRADRRPGDRHRLRGPARHRPALSPERHRQAGAGRPRGAAGQRCDRLAPAPAALRRRPGRAAAGNGHPGGARPGRRRRQPAGSPADPHHLQGPPHPHPERAGGQPARARLDGPGICLVPARAAHHGAQPARRVRQVRSGARDAGSRVPRPAALPRQVRRAAAPVPGVHRLGLQPAAGEPGRGADQEPGAHGGTGDPAQLPRQRARSHGRRRGDPPDPDHLCGQGARPLRAGGVPARARR